MIDTPRSSYYRTAEYIQFLSNVFQIMEANDAATLLVQPQTSALENAMGDLDAEYKRQTSSTITATLAELDERRDNAFTGIQRVVSGFELHFDPAKVTAAQRIGLVFSKYGLGVTRLRYQQETGEINAIIQDLSGDPAVAAALTALGLDAWVTELMTANSAFDGAYVQRAREMAGDPSQVLALRAAAGQTWEDLKAHLTAHATLTPSQLYKDTVAQLNSLISDYNDATAARTPSDGEAGTGTTPAPTPAPVPAP